MSSPINARGGAAIAGACRGRLLPGLRRQLDRLTVRRVARGLGPGVLALRQLVAADQALGGDQALERGEPVQVVGVAEIGVAGGLRGADLAGEGLGPLGPREVPG